MDSELLQMWLRDCCCNCNYIGAIIQHFYDVIQIIFWCSSLHLMQWHIGHRQKVRGRTSPKLSQSTIIYCACAIAFLSLDHIYGLCTLHLSSLLSRSLCTCAGSISGLLSSCNKQEVTLAAARKAYHAVITRHNPPQRMTLYGSQENAS